MKHTLLLVEDELGIRETVKIFLKSQNYEVIEAENGKEGGCCFRFTLDREVTEDES